MVTEKISNLLDQYFDLAFAEGKEGRNHDTEEGDAQRVRSELEAALSTDAEPVAYRPSYQQIKDTVQANINRMHNAGESHIMMARWLSADLDKLYPPQPAPSVAVKNRGSE